MAAGRWRSAATSSGRFPFALEQLRQLGGRCRLARALQTGHQNDERWRRGSFQRSLLTEGVDQLLVDDLDDLLAGGEALGDVGSERPLLYPGEERLDHADIDVSLEQAPAALRAAQRRHRPRKDALCRAIGRRRRRIVH